MYANDIRYSFALYRQHVTENDIIRELLKVFEWLGSNKLSLKVAKTK